MPRTSLCIALLALTCAAHAQVYRCKGADGAVTFSDVPCPSSARESRALDVKPAYNPEPGHAGRPDDATARMLEQMKYEREAGERRDAERRRQEASDEAQREQRKYWDKKDCSRYQQYADEARLKIHNGGTVADLNRWAIEEKTWSDRIKRECGL